jgi:type IV pilus assembly protein PilM
MTHTVALDIGTYTIKAVQGQFGKTSVIDRTVEVFNTTGLSLPTNDAETEKLADLLSAMFNDHRLARSDVRLSLPEHLVSTKIISIPSLTDAELASAINWQAEQHIPIPLDELSLEYQVLYRPDRRDRNELMRVLMVGARKSIVEQFLSPFARLGIEPTVLETSVLSVYRSLQFTAEDPTTLIMHIGAATTDFVVIQRGEISFVYTYATAGQVLTRTLEQAIQLEPKQAEQYKRTYGLDPNQLQGKIRNALLPIMKNITLEMQKAIQFFVSQQPGESIKRVLLSGGSSQLPGLVEFVTEQVGVEVLLASPFAGAQGEIPAANQPAFTLCMGLMMRPPA